MKDDGKFFETPPMAGPLGAGLPELAADAPLPECAATLAGADLHDASGEAAADQQPRVLPPREM